MVTEAVVRLWQRWVVVMAVRCTTTAVPPLDGEVERARTVACRLHIGIPLVHWKKHQRACNHLSPNLHSSSPSPSRSPLHPAIAFSVTSSLSANKHRGSYSRPSFQPNPSVASSHAIRAYLGTYLAEACQSSILTPEHRHNPALTSAHTLVHSHTRPAVSFAKPTRLSSAARTTRIRYNTKHTSQEYPI